MDQNIAAFVGSIPEFYDRGLGPVLFADYADLMAARVAAVAPSSVLEIAAGTGIVTEALRKRLTATTRITATDLNPPMLDVARQKLEKANGVEFQAVDAQQLPFVDAAFDAIVCQFGIMFYPDRPKSFAEALRVLKPGGHYFFSVWDEHRYNRYAGITHDLVKRTFPVNTPNFYHVPFSCAAIDPIKEMTLEAGFTQLEISVMTIDKTVADLDMFSKGLIFGNPIIGQINERGQTSAETIRGELLSLLKSEFGQMPAQVPLQTLFYRATKPA
ncbi:class I SAM-dependent methyltransferase [Devosia sp.]|uniref:class I SAM-dependent methyltransferase n=1 Tax=Devosia sp. TaxID=1871048 RepID=UPI001AC8C857|nr:class I SAM-dependent methyltransferase [Devosia sp.]MBN9336180.1 methyltransferase domain-containing protein [Devosia sp.]